MEILDKSLAVDERTKKIVYDAVLKYGRVSIYYLMRKLNCTPSMAKEIINRLGVAS